MIARFMFFYKPGVTAGRPCCPACAFRGKCWRSAPAGHSEGTREEVPAIRQEELPAVEPEVPVVLGVPEVLETSGPVPPVTP